MSKVHIDQGVIHYKNESFHFIKIGHGPQLGITFHGMDGDPSNFFILQKHLLDQYTFISFYLPHHGPQKLKAKALKPEAIMAAIQGVKNNFDVEQFSLWGHSLGARICLKIVELQPNWVSELILFSPDGIAKNPWYKMATSSRLGRYIFKKFTQNPEIFVNFIAKARLSSKNRISSVKRVIKNSNKLEKTYLTWTSLHYLVPFLAVVKINIKKQKIKTHIFIGKQDPIIPYKSINSFARKQSMIHTYVLEDGHHLLTKKHMDLFLSILK